jgi:hypothetical protein
VARQMEEPQQVQHMQQQQQRQQQQEQPSQPPVVTPVAATAPYAPPTGVKKTFYKRKLPCPPATEFSSADGVLNKDSRLACICTHDLADGMLCCIAAECPCSLWWLPCCIVDLVTPNDMDH